jgi:hypothetical protein
MIKRGDEIGYIDKDTMDFVSVNAETDPSLSTVVDSGEAPTVAESADQSGDDWQYTDLFCNSSEIAKAVKSYLDEAIAQEEEAPSITSYVHKSTLRISYLNVRDRCEWDMQLLGYRDGLSITQATASASALSTTVPDKSSVQHLPNSAADAVPDKGDEEVGYSIARRFFSDGTNLARLIAAALAAKGERVRQETWEAAVHECDVRARWHEGNADATPRNTEKNTLYNEGQVVAAKSMKGLASKFCEAGRQPGIKP